MRRPKTVSELHKEAFDKANAERPISERIKEPTLNQSQLGDLIKEIDVLKPES
jgi:hypothetical protein